MFFHPTHTDHDLRDCDIFLEFCALLHEHYDIVFLPKPKAQNVYDWKRLKNLRHAYCCFYNFEAIDHCNGQNPVLTYPGLLRDDVNFDYSCCGRDPKNENVLLLHWWISEKKSVRHFLGAGHFQHYLKRCKGFCIAE